MKRTLWLLGVLTLSACTVVVSPGLGRRQSLEIIRLGQQAASSGTAATVTSSVPSPVALPTDDSGTTTAPRCGPYTQPEHPPMPELPGFTKEESRDNEALSRRLGGYITQLRDYILLVDKQDSEAYAKYQQSCNPLPVGPAS